MPAHHTAIRVRFSELDPYNHVNHAVYVTWFEVGRSEALAAAGLPLEAMAAEGWQFVISELHVRFRAPAMAGDEVVVETAVSEMGASATRWRQRVVRRDGTVLVEGEVRAATTDLAGRPRRMPPALADRLRPLLSEA